MIDWPCSGERIVGGSDFAAMPVRYPTDTGRCRFAVHRVVADEATVVSEVTVTDSEQSLHVVTFSDVDGQQITGRVEKWSTPYDPLPGQDGLIRPADRIR